MRIRLLTITHKSPAWVVAGYEEYAKRLSGNCRLELVEIPAEKRGTNVDLAKIKKNEGEKMLSFINSKHYVIALTITGNLWSTEQLATQMQTWLANGQNIDLLVGGPEGLADVCIAKAKSQWSLSPLTFPHFLVKVIVAEQLYRANTILQNHPYHR